MSNTGICQMPVLPSFTRTAQDAPGIHAGEEWAFLIEGRSGRVKHLFVHQNLLVDKTVKT
jgi:hypothetical protein